MCQPTKSSQPTGPKKIYSQLNAFFVEKKYIWGSHPKNTPGYSLKLCFQKQIAQYKICGMCLRIFKGIMFTMATPVCDLDMPSFVGHVLYVVYHTQC